MQTMTHDQLEALIAVVEHGSFRSAAKALHKTQSTVSAAVKNLERELGIQLLDRNHYRPSLTPQGNAFVVQAKQVSLQFDRLYTLGKQLAAGDDPSLAIVMSGICTLPLLLETLRHNIKAFPQTRFSVSTEHMSGVIEQLNKGEADIAIGPSMGIDHRHEYSQIGTVTMMSVSAQGYITQRNASITQEYIRNYVHILVPDSGREEPSAHVNVIPGERCWHVNDYASKKEFIRAGLGWGRLPESMIQDELKTGELHPIEIEGIPGQQKLPIFIIRRLGHSTGPVFQHLWDQVCSMNPY